MCGTQKVGAEGDRSPYVRSTHVQHNRAVSWGPWLNFALRSEAWDLLFCHLAGLTLWKALSWARPSSCCESAVGAVDGYDGDVGRTGSSHFREKDLQGCRRPNQTPSAALSCLGRGLLEHWNDLGLDSYHGECPTFSLWPQEVYASTPIQCLVCSFLATDKVNKVFPWGLAC